MSGELPEAILRFEPVTVESGLLDAAKIGRVQRCIVVLAGEDIAELEISNLRYEQDGAMPGQWSVSLFADPGDPLRRTARFGR